MLCEYAIHSWTNTTKAENPCAQQFSLPFFFCLKGEKRNHCTFLAKSTFEIKDVKLTICEQ